MKAEKIMKRFLSALLLLSFITFLVVPIFVDANSFFYRDGVIHKVQSEYERGVNEALDIFMLLNLELSLKGERKTWGEMADIIRERLGVEK